MLIFVHLSCSKYIMGRLWSKIKQGVKKIGRFIGRVGDKVSNVAGVLSNVPILGGVASTVARGANLVSKIGNGAVAKGAGLVSKIGHGAANLIEKGEQIRQKYQPTIDKVKDAAQAVYKTGIPDKLTRGGVTRVLNRVHGIRDRLERKYDTAAGHAAGIGRRIESGVNRAQTVVNAAVRPG